MNISSVEHLRQRMRDRLSSRDGKELFSLRRQTAEPVFGQMKSNRGFDRFLLWGKSGATAESALMCMAHNLFKCVRSKASAGLALLARLQMAAESRSASNIDSLRSMLRLHPAICPCF